MVHTNITGAMFHNSLATRFFMEKSHASRVSPTPLGIFHTTKNLEKSLFHKKETEGWWSRRWELDSLATPHSSKQKGPFHPLFIKLVVDKKFSCIDNHMNK